MAAANGGAQARGASDIIVDIIGVISNGAYPGTKRAAAYVGAEKYQRSGSIWRNWRNNDIKPREISRRQRWRHRRKRMACAK